jgi:hypothetical protein
MSEPPSWSITPDFPQLAFGTLVVSFQRYALPETGLIEGELPSSLGALPVAAVGRRFLLPVAFGEAFWIGLAMEARVALQLRLTPVPAEGQAEEERIALPRVRAIPGWRRQGDASLRPFTRSGTAVSMSLAELRLVAEAGKYPPATATIELVDYPAYAARSGQPAPDQLDPEAGYKGYLLP